MIDFEVNYKAGQRLAAGETLYPGPAVDGHYEFKYPPCAALLYLPLTLLPLGPAKGLWALLVLAASAAAVMVSLRLVRASDRLPWYFSALPGLILARYFLRELQLGQVNAVIAFLLLTMTLLLVEEGGRLSPRTKEGLAGLTWGLAVAIKTYGLIFLPYFLLKKQWRVLAAGLAVLAAGFLVPIFFYGLPGSIEVHREWVSTLSRSTPHLFSSQDNVSLLALAVKYTGDLRLSLLVWAIFTGLISVFFLGGLLRDNLLPRPKVLECAALMLLVPLVSPLGWDYTFLLAVLGLTLCFRHLAELPPAWRAVFAVDAGFIFLSLYDLLGRRLYAGFMALSLPTYFFLVLLIFLFRLRWKKLA